MTLQSVSIGVIVRGVSDTINYQDGSAHLPAYHPSQVVFPLRNGLKAVLFLAEGALLWAASLVILWGHLVFSLEICIMLSSGVENYIPNQSWIEYSFVSLVAAFTVEISERDLGPWPLALLKQLLILNVHSIEIYGLNKDVSVHLYNNGQNKLRCSVFSYCTITKYR